MREKHVKNKQTLMSKKFFSMLFGGTLTMMVVSLLLMSDQIIAGLVIGSDAVAGITMVTPIYSLSAFIGAVISLAYPLHLCLGVFGDCSKCLWGWLRHLLSLMLF